MGEGRHWLAIGLHGVEPATFERCAPIRDWLSDLGVDRATLFVTPAPRMRPFFQASPQLAEWLLERRERGGCGTQHGFAGGAGAEFPALSRSVAREKLAAGRRLLRLAGLDPRGFVASGYSST